MREKEIQDRLVNQLNLLEPGLSFIDANYPLPNSVGSRGFVDILARDRNNCLVIIELKRSDAAARQALHELAKYVELFQREKGLGSADVRTMIVSTEWRELLAPFSQAAREWSVNLRGYRLILESDGITPSAAQEVQPLPIGLTISPTPIQTLIQTSNGDLDPVWRWASRRLQTVGARNIIGLDVRHSTYESGVYLVIGTMDPESPEVTELFRLAEAGDYDLTVRV